MSRTCATLSGGNSGTAACYATTVTFACPWFLIDSIWNSIFILELLINIYSHWYITTLHGHFFCSTWNLFDLLVVCVSIPAMSGRRLPPPMGQLRMLRAFRVFRLFKRVRSLNKIIMSRSVGSNPHLELSEEGCRAAMRSSIEAVRPFCARVPPTQPHGWRRGLHVCSLKPSLSHACFRVDPTGRSSKPSRVSLTRCETLI